MNGHVDTFGRAIVNVSIRASDIASIHVISVWIDTGFNGDLVLSQRQINDLALPPSGTLKAVLADGSEVTLLRYTCLIDWFGDERELEVIANEGEYPLLGIGLLTGYDLFISYRNGNITIE